MTKRMDEVEDVRELAGIPGFGGHEYEGEQEGE